MNISTIWRRMLSVLAAISMVAVVTPVFAPAAAAPVDSSYPVCLQQWEWGRQQQDFLQLPDVGGMQGFCAGLAGDVPDQPLLVPADFSPPISPPIRPRQNVVGIES